MSEEAKPAEQIPAPTETQKPAPEWTKPPGYDPVDLEELGVSPEARAPIEARIRHLYSQAKAGTEAKREARELREHLEKLTPVVERLAERETARGKEQIEEAIVQARANNDVRTELKLQGELAQFNNAPKPQPPPQPSQEVYVEAAKGWASEINDDGSLKRPWIQSDHPENVKALGHLHQVRADWESRGIQISPQTMPLLLNEIDRRMQTQPQKPQAPAVLSTSQAKPPKKADEIELTQEQKHVARRLYSSMAADKAEAAYANAIKLQARVR